MLLRNAVLPRGERGYDRWFDPNAFALPARGTYGTAPKDVFRGPGINGWDVGVKRTFKVHEKLSLEFRADSYNFFNHTQWSSVSTGARFDANGNQIHAALGTVTGARAPRRMEMSIRVRF